MTGILRVRQESIKFFKRYEFVIIFCLKMMVGFIVFRLINGVGLYNARFAPLFQPPLDFPYIALSSLLFACLPPTLAITLAAAEAVIQISASLEVAVYAGAGLFCLIVFYARLAPKTSFLIIAALLGFWLKLPYAVVIFAGLYWGFSAILPLTLGALVYQFAPLFTTLAGSFQTPEKIDITVLPQTFMEVYKTLFYSVTARDNFGWVYLGFSFAMTVIAVYVISRLSINRARDAAVILGGAMCLLCALMGIALKIMRVSVAETLFCTAFSVLLVEGIRFMEPALEYKRAENVEFEDEDNHYYVKIIPKVIISARKKAAKPAAAKAAVRPPAARPTGERTAERPTAKPMEKTTAKPIRPMPSVGERRGGVERSESDTE